MKGKKNEQPNEHKVNKSPLSKKTTGSAENIVAWVSSSKELGSSSKNKRDYHGYKAFMGYSPSYIHNLLLLLCTSLRVSQFLEILSVPTDVHSGVALVPHFSTSCTAVARLYLV